MIRTLVVDDDARFRRSVKGVLAGEPGIEVIGEAGSGLEAMEKAGELRPDLVLMDMRMPEMNGMDATRRLKKEMPAIRVIMLTLYDFDEYREAAKAAGVGGYILKKSMKKELVPAIMNHDL